MESDRFDQIVRALTVAPSRRGLVQILSAGVLAAGWNATADTAIEAKSKKKKRKKKKKCKPKCDKECQICKKGRCKSLADGTPCDSADICENGECVALRCGNGGPCTVFMTIAGVKGAEIGGLAGGDDFCQDAADAAGLSGTFKAWLSAGNASPSTRFTNLANAGPYQLVPNQFADGSNPPPTVAADFADLTSCNPGPDGICLQAAINRTEDGTVQGGQPLIWTGTQTNGTAAPDTCAGWTGAGNGAAGVATQIINEWTNAGSFDCQSPLPLYCFAQA
jgi:hypothetical protein